MLRKSLAVLLCSCAAAFGAQADDVELALTEETLQGTYITDGSMVGLGGSDLSLGLLFSDDRDIVLNAGLMVPGLGEDGMGGDVMPGPITVRFGAKAFGALLADPSDDIFAIAPGVEARYAIPTGIPLAAVANFFYSPDILTFGNAEDVFDFNVRLEAQFVERATGFVGFRRLSFDRDGGGTTTSWSISKSASDSRSERRAGRRRIAVSALARLADGAPRGGPIAGHQRARLLVVRAGGS